MRFSVLICTHNRAETLSQALGFVGQLDVPPEWGWEIVVVDNASRDATAKAVADFQARSPVPVRYLHEPRLGHSFALNTGVAGCRGEIIAFTDDDACPDPSWLLQLDRMFREQKADLVFGKVTPVWEGRAPRWFSERFNPYFALLDYGPEPFVVTDVDKPFYGVNHAVKRSVLQALGGYREDIGLYGNKGGIGNDLDLFQRALAAGQRIVYNPAAHVRHMIELCRYKKGYWRKKTWASTAFQFDFLQANPPEVPFLLGLPRYFYPLAISQLLGYLKSLVSRDRSLAFYHELRLIRFTGLLFQSYRRFLTRRAVAAKA